MRSHSFFPWLTTTITPSLKAIQRNSSFPSRRLQINFLDNRPSIDISCAELRGGTLWPEANIDNYIHHYRLSHLYLILKILRAMVWYVYF